MTLEKDGPELIDHGLVFEKAGLVHRVLRPGGDGAFSPGPYPTVVMIHGRSGNEDVMWIFQRAVPKGWLVAAPRAIKRDPDGGFAWHPRHRDEWPTLDMFDEAVSAVVKFIHSLPGLYEADPERIYLMGFSQGAATAVATAMGYPNLVQGIALLVGFTPEDCESEVERLALEGLPVFMAVGSEDDRIPLSISRKSAEILKTAGAELTYGEFRTGHKLNAEGMRALKTWWAGRS